jgi:hypothetical protein
MKPPPLSTTCPLCDNAFTVPAAELESAERWPGGEVERVAVECPVCAWEFTADGEGRALDDELDREGPFEVAPEGGPDAEGLLTVTCPHCGAVHQTGEPGVTRCPRCRRLLPIDAEGEVEDETIYCYPCPRCTNPIREARAAATDLYCGACGYLQEWGWGPSEYEEDSLEEGQAPTCPNCGHGFQEYEGGDLFLPFEGGRVQCPCCAWVFTSPAGAEEYVEAEGTAPRPPGFEGRERYGQEVVYTVAADGSGDFTTLGQALAKSPWQAVSVRIRPGRYDECLVVEQTVELVADGPPGSVCLHSAEGPCLRIGCDTVTVRGLRLESPDVAVEVSDGHPLLVDCSFHGGTAGILVHDPQARPVLRGCRVEGWQVGVWVVELALATLEGCIVRGTAGAGVEVLGGGRLRLDRCRVLSAGAEGVCVRRAGEAELADCVLADAACAGVAVDGGKVRLARCQLQGCGVGCCVLGGLAALEDCTARDCRTVAVSVLPGGQALLRRCRLEGSLHALCAAGLSRSLLDECHLAGCEAAVLLRGRARARLRHCRLDGPERSAVVMHHTAEVSLEGCGPTLRAG